MGTKGNDYKPVQIRVISPAGKTETFQSKYRTCKTLDIQMTALQSFLKQGTVQRGRYKGYQFYEVA